MIIDSYAIALSSAQESQSSIEERLSLSRQSASSINRSQPRVDDNNTADLANSVDSASAELSQDSLNLQRRITDLRNSLENGERGLSDAIESLFSDDSVDDDIQSLDAQTYQLKSLVESLIGREIDLREVRESASASESEQLNAQANGQAQASTVTIFEAFQRVTESETSTFAAQGQLQTTDGQVINIDLSQTLQREFVSEISLQVISEESELKDPLVINLPNSTLDLTDNRVSFDIDADGELDEVNFATGNSGFLSLDINGNGVIDDGSELFGAISGNGFTDLANYDEDGNNFIDEGDSVFARLQILRKDEAGNDSLTSIQQTGIGALFLGNTSTPFEVRDADNQLDAVVRSSGFYLTENGQAGTLQQIDLVV